MTAGDFPIGKEFDCPDCLLVNGHPDAVPQINFCVYCKRRGIIQKLYETDNVTLVPSAEIKKAIERAR